MPPFSISTVIPTVGRASLDRAVESVLGQSIDPSRSEVIVVNDGTASLSPAAWQESPRVRMLSSARPRSGPSAARNLGSLEARGHFLHFLDDDDWMLPGAFAAFASAHRRTPSARWLYGIVKRQSRSGEDRGAFPDGLEGNVLAAILSGEWLPFQGSLVERRLFGELGGFNPAYPVSEDVDLQLRLSLETDLCRVRTPVCVYSEGVEASTTRRDLYAEYLFRAHDALFDRAEMVPRAVASATTPHLYGKVLRHCLIALRDALVATRPWAALRRAAVLVALLGRAGRALWTRELWRALRSNHAGMTPRPTAV